MGAKYRIMAFDYPYAGSWDYNKQTEWLVIALFWTVVYSLKHFGVNLEKRG